MALLVKASVSFELTNAPITQFRSGPVVNQSTSLPQSFGADIAIPTTAVDQVVSLQGVDRAQHIFIHSDQAVDVKFILQGHTAGDTFSMRLMPGVPSILAFQNIIGIAVTNASGTEARLMVYGAGIDVP